ncbi:ABC transporter substrate-binding protein [Phormidium tenue FACHB-886]|nr:ABC transporter substrate-binding protein [Phormidium tenue FACHB-886]
MLASLLALSIGSGCRYTPNRPLRVAVNQWPGYETLYLARSLGYYEKTLIQLIDLPSGTEQVRAFRNDNVEAAAISLDQALALADTNSDVRVVMVMDFSEGGDVILAKPEIADLKALKGKRVGVEATALGAYILTRALEQINLSTQDVQIVSLGLSEHERAFKTGAIDAVVTFGPARINLLAAGANQIFDSSQIPGEIVDVLIVRQEVIINQPEAVEALVKGRFQALDYLTQHPQDSARRIAPRTGVTPNQFLESLVGLRSPNLRENQKLLGKINLSLLAAARRLASIMHQHQLLRRPIDPAPLLDDRIVKKIQF